MAIEVGDLVKVKPHNLKEALGIDRIKGGGEGKVESISEDTIGTVYRVFMIHTQRYRSVRREGLVIHHKPKPKKKRRKKRGNP